MAVDDQLAAVAAVDLEDAVVQAPVGIGVAVVERGIERRADRRERGVGGGDEVGVGRPWLRVIGFTPMLRQFRIVAVLVAALARAGCGIKGPLVLPPRRRRRAAGRRRRPPPPSTAPPATSNPGDPIADARRAQAVSAFAYRDGELCAEGVPLSAIAAQFGTPCYVYSRAALEARVPRVRRRVRGHPAPRLLRDEGEPEPRGAQPLRAAGQRLRHRVRRRTRARARGRRRPAQGRVLRRRQDAKPRWRRRSTPASSASTSSPASRARPPRRRRRPRRARARRSASA